MAVAYAGNAFQLNSYRTNSVVGLTPGELLLKMYDVALVALIAGDGKRGALVLSKLIESLDFEHQEVAVGLFQLYRYCMDEVKTGEYEVAVRILRDLRDTWATALGR
jgi:flagellin-specific chaperone FliS